MLYKVVYCSIYRLFTSQVGCRISLSTELTLKIFFKVTRVSGSTEFSSSLRVSQRLFTHHSGSSEMSFYRLSMPIQCAAILNSPAGGALPVASSSLSPGSDDGSFNIISYTVCSNYHKLIYPCSIIEVLQSCYEMKID